jgi:hypothetical protein
MKRLHRVYRDLAAFLLFLVLFSSHAFGATITVTNTNDNGPGSLRQAIEDASSGDTINFSVTGMIALPNFRLVVDKNLTIYGPGPSLLSIGNPPVGDVFLISSGVTASVSGITIRGAGYSDADGGSGILNLGTLAVSDIVVSNNFGYVGGGILTGSGSMMTIKDSVISGNDALEGGGITNRGTMAITNSTVSGNTSSFGGGIQNTGNLTLTNSNVWGNRSCWHESAYCVGPGGGISNRDSGSVTITNSTIAGNVARDGGGLYNRGTAHISNSTISGNLATYDSVGNTESGGGIWTSGTLTITSSTISKNTAEWFYASGASGGIMSSCGTETLRNSIVAGNTVYDTKVADIGGTIETASHNLIGDPNSSGEIANGVNGNIVGVDPLLGPLQNNGGPTLSHALFLGSPAVNQGDNSLSIVGTDQRGFGFPRIFGGTVDIGAFEVSDGPVSVSGRVTTPDGGGLRNSIVTLTDSVGARRTAITSTLGYYSFDNVTPGQTYSIGVQSRRYRFSSNQLQIDTAVTGVDFVAIE